MRSRATATLLVFSASLPLLACDEPFTSIGSDSNRASQGRTTSTAGGSALESTPSTNANGGNNSAVLASVGGSPAMDAGLAQNPGIGGSLAVDAGVGVLDVCATGALVAQFAPLYMVFVYDRSASMGDDPAGGFMNAASRWEPLKLGMIDFFANPGMPSVEASLEFFPAPGDKTVTCQHDYEIPAVHMTALSAPQTLVDALEYTRPVGGTPTLPAVVGGISYARRLMVNNPGAKAVVVLVTDGEPAMYNAATGAIETDCAPVGSDLTNTIADVSAVVNAAYRGSPAIQTYVIGIGEAQNAMGAIATAGGTEYVLLDATDPPEQTRAALTRSLREIRAAHFECTIPIPKIAGFDPDLVNAKFIHSSGFEELLRESRGCASPGGWQYDSDVAPSSIFLCSETCSAIQADPTGTVQLQFGCGGIVL